MPWGLFPDGGVISSLFQTSFAFEKSSTSGTDGLPAEPEGSGPRQHGHVSVAPEAGKSKASMRSAMIGLMRKAYQRSGSEARGGMGRAVDGGQWIVDR